MIRISGSNAGTAASPSGAATTHVMSGGAAYALHEKAAELGAGLIIVGSTHRGTLGRITLGTIADRVLDHSPCPVAVAPRGFRDEGATPQRIGVAFVDTPGGRSALRAEAAIARCAGASLIAYTVIEPHTHDADRERAEAALERAIEQYAHYFDVQARVLTNGGVEALVSESRQLDDGTLTTVTVCDDRAEVEASVSRAGGWVLRNLDDLVEGPPRVVNGEVKAHIEGAAD